MNGLHYTLICIYEYMLFNVWTLVRLALASVPALAALTVVPTLAPVRK